MDVAENLGLVHGLTLENPLEDLLPGQHLRLHSIPDLLRKKLGRDVLLQRLRDGFGFTAGAEVRFVKVLAGLSLLGLLLEVSEVWNLVNGLLPMRLLLVKQCVLAVLELVNIVTYAVELPVEAGLLFVELVDGRDHTIFINFFSMTTTSTLKPKNLPSF